MLLILVRVDSTALSGLVPKRNCSSTDRLLLYEAPQSSLLSSPLHDMYTSPPIRNHMVALLFLVCSIIAVCSMTPTEQLSSFSKVWLRCESG